MFSKFASYFLKLVGSSGEIADVNANGELKVEATATNLDIRDLSSASDSVAAVCTATDLDIRNLNATDDKIQLAALDSNISTNSGKQLKVTVYRSDGTEGKLDPTTGSLVGMDYAHQEIHAGDHFFITNYVTLANTNTLVFGVTTPNTTKWSHMYWEILTTGQTLFQIYEAATYTGGTPVTQFNNNRNSLTASTLSIVTAPSISVAGTIISAALVGIASTNQKALGGTASRDDEIILKQNTQYVFKFTSNSNDNNITYRAFWYEHTNLS